MQVGSGRRNYPRLISHDWFKATYKRRRRQLPMGLHASASSTVVYVGYCIGRSAVPHALPISWELWGRAPQAVAEGGHAGNCSNAVPSDGTAL